MLLPLCVFLSGVSNDINLLLWCLQKVFLLPKTVLAVVDSNAFNGQAYCYRQNKGQCNNTLNVFCFMSHSSCDYLL